MHDRFHTYAGRRQLSRELTENANHMSPPRPRTHFKAVTLGNAATGHHHQHQSTASLGDSSQQQINILHAAAEAASNMSPAHNNNRHNALYNTLTAANFNLAALRSAAAGSGPLLEHPAASGAAGSVLDTWIDAWKRGADAAVRDIAALVTEPIHATASNCDNNKENKAPTRLPAMDANTRPAFTRKYLARLHQLDDSLRCLSVYTTDSSALVSERLTRVLPSLLDWYVHAQNVAADMAIISPYDRSPRPKDHRARPANAAAASPASAVSAARAALSSRNTTNAADIQEAVRRAENHTLAVNGIFSYSLLWLFTVPSSESSAEIEQRDLHHTDGGANITKQSTSPYHQSGTHPATRQREQKHNTSSAPFAKTMNMTDWNGTAHQFDRKYRAAAAHLRSAHVSDLTRACTENNTYQRALLRAHTLPSGTVSQLAKMALNFIIAPSNRLQKPKRTWQRLLSSTSSRRLARALANEQQAALKIRIFYQWSCVICVLPECDILPPVLALLANAAPGSHVIRQMASGPLRTLRLNISKGPSSLHMACQLLQILLTKFRGTSKHKRKAEICAALTELLRPTASMHNVWRQDLDYTEWFGLVQMVTTEVLAFAKQRGARRYWSQLCLVVSVALSACPQQHFLTHYEDATEFLKRAYLVREARAASTRAMSNLIERYLSMVGYNQQHGVKKHYERVDSDDSDAVSADHAAAGRPVVGPEPVCDRRREPVRAAVLALAHFLLLLPETASSSTIAAANPTHSRKMTLDRIATSRFASAVAHSASPLARSRNHNSSSLGKQQAVNRPTQKKHSRGKQDTQCMGRGWLVHDTQRNLVQMIVAIARWDLTVALQHIVLPLLRTMSRTTDVPSGPMSFFDMNSQLESNSAAEHVSKFTFPPGFFDSVDSKAQHGDVCARALLGLQVLHRLFAGDHLRAPAPIRPPRPDVAEPWMVMSGCTDCDIASTGEQMTPDHSSVAPWFSSLKRTFTRRNTIAGGAFNSQVMSELERDIEPVAPWITSRVIEESINLKLLSLGSDEKNIDDALASALPLKKTNQTIHMALSQTDTSSPFRDPVQVQDKKQDACDGSEQDAFDMQSRSIVYLSGNNIPRHSLRSSISNLLAYLMAESFSLINQDRLLVSESRKGSCNSDMHPVAKQALRLAILCIPHVWPRSSGLQEEQLVSMVCKCLVHRDSGIRTAAEAVLRILGSPISVVTSALKKKNTRGNGASDDDDSESMVLKTPKSSPFLMYIPRDMRVSVVNGLVIFMASFPSAADVQRDENWMTATDVVSVHPVLCPVLKLLRWIIVEWCDAPPQPAALRTLDVQGLESMLLVWMCSAGSTERILSLHVLNAVRHVFHMQRARIDAYNEAKQEQQSDTLTRDRVRHVGGPPKLELGAQTTPHRLDAEVLRTHTMREQQRIEDDMKRFALDDDESDLADERKHHHKESTRQHMHSSGPSFRGHKIVPCNPKCAPWPAANVAKVIDDMERVMCAQSPMFFAANSTLSSIVSTTRHTLHVGASESLVSSASCANAPSSSSNLIDWQKIFKLIGEPVPKQNGLDAPNSTVSQAWPLLQHLAATDAESPSCQLQWTLMVASMIRRIAKCDTMHGTVRRLYANVSSRLQSLLHRPLRKKAKTPVKKRRPSGYFNKDSGADDSVASPRKEKAPKASVNSYHDDEKFSSTRLIEWRNYCAVSCACDETLQRWVTQDLFKTLVPFLAEKMVADASRRAIPRLIATSLGGASIAGMSSLFPLLTELQDQVVSNALQGRLPGDRRRSTVTTNERAFAKPAISAHLRMNISHIFRLISETLVTNNGDSDAGLEALSFCIHFVSHYLDSCRAFLVGLSADDHSIDELKLNFCFTIRAYMEVIRWNESFVMSTKREYEFLDGQHSRISSGEVDSSDQKVINEEKDVENDNFDNDDDDDEFDALSEQSIKCRMQRRRKLLDELGDDCIRRRHFFALLLSWCSSSSYEVLPEELLFSVVQHPLAFCRENPALCPVESDAKLSVFLLPNVMATMSCLLHGRNFDTQLVRQLEVSSACSNGGGTFGNSMVLKWIDSLLSSSRRLIRNFGHISLRSLLVANGHLMPLLVGCCYISMDPLISAGYFFVIAEASIAAIRHAQQHRGLLRESARENDGQEICMALKDVSPIPMAELLHLILFKLGDTSAAVRNVTVRLLLELPNFRFRPPARVSDIGCGGFGNGGDVPERVKSPMRSDALTLISGELAANYRPVQRLVSAQLAREFKQFARDLLKEASLRLTLVSTSEERSMVLRYILPWIRPACIRLPQDIDNSAGNNDGASIRMPAKDRKNGVKPTATTFFETVERLMNLTIIYGADSNAPSGNEHEGLPVERLWRKMAKSLHKGNVKCINDEQHEKRNDSFENRHEEDGDNYASCRYHTFVSVVRHVVKSIHNSDDDSGENAVSESLLHAVQQVVLYFSREESHLVLCTILRFCGTLRSGNDAARVIDRSTLLTKSGHERTRDCANSPLTLRLLCAVIYDCDRSQLNPEVSIMNQRHTMETIASLLHFGTVGILSDCQSARRTGGSLLVNLLHGLAFRSGGIMLETTAGARGWRASSRVSDFDTIRESERGEGGDGGPCVTHPHAVGQQSKHTASSYMSNAFPFGLLLSDRPHSTCITSLSSLSCVHASVEDGDKENSYLQTLTHFLPESFLRCCSSSQQRSLRCMQLLYKISHLDSGSEMTTPAKTITEQLVQAVADSMYDVSAQRGPRTEKQLRTAWAQCALETALGGNINQQTRQLSHRVFRSLEFASVSSKMIQGAISSAEDWIAELVAARSSSAESFMRSHGLGRWRLHETIRTLLYVLQRQSPADSSVSSSASAAAFGSMGEGGAIMTWTIGIAERIVSIAMSAIDLIMPSGRNSLYKVLVDAFEIVPMSFKLLSVVLQQPSVSCSKVFSANVTLKLCECVMRVINSSAFGGFVPPMQCMELLSLLCERLGVLVRDSIHRASVSSVECMSANKVALALRDAIVVFLPWIMTSLPESCEPGTAQKVKKDAKTTLLRASAIACAGRLRSACASANLPACSFAFKIVASSESGGSGNIDRGSFLTQSKEIMRRMMHDDGETVLHACELLLRLLGVRHCPTPASSARAVLLGSRSMSHASSPYIFMNDNMTSVDAVHRLFCGEAVKALSGSGGSSPSYLPPLTVAYRNSVLLILQLIIESTPWGGCFADKRAEFVFHSINTMLQFPGLRKQAGDVLRSALRLAERNSGMAKHSNHEQKESVTQVAEQSQRRMESNVAFNEPKKGGEGRKSAAAPLWRAARRAAGKSSPREQRIWLWKQQQKMESNRLADNVRVLECNDGESVGAAGGDISNEYEIFDVVDDESNVSSSNYTENVRVLSGGNKLPPEHHGKGNELEGNQLYAVGAAASESNNDLASASQRVNLMQKQPNDAPIRRKHLNVINQLESTLSRGRRPGFQTRNVKMDTDKRSEDSHSPSLMNHVVKPRMSSRLRGQRRPSASKHERFKPDVHAERVVAGLESPENSRKQNEKSGHSGVSSRAASMLQGQAGSRISPLLSKVPSLDLNINYDYDALKREHEASSASRRAVDIFGGDADIMDDLDNGAGSCGSPSVDPVFLNNSIEVDLRGNAYVRNSDSIDDDMSFNGMSARNHGIGSLRASQRSMQSAPGSAGSSGREGRQLSSPRGNRGHMESFQQFNVPQKRSHALRRLSVSSNGHVSNNASSVSPASSMASRQNAALGGRDVSNDKWKMKVSGSGLDSPVGAPYHLGGGIMSHDEDDDALDFGSGMGMKSQRYAKGHFNFDKEN